MSFATLADLRTAHRLYQSACVATQAAETTDTWALVAATIPTAATTPGTVNTGDSTLFNFPDTSTAEKYMTEWSVQTPSNAAAGSYMLLDRLVSVSQSITTTGVKTINSSALTRYTTGDGVMVWVEVTTQTATSAAVINLNSYTNSAGTGSRSGASITFVSTAMNVGSWVQLPLQDGDSGVKSVESINVTTAPTAGVISVVLAKPLAFSGVNNGQSGAVQATLNTYLVPIRIYDGASLAAIIKGYSGAERTNTSVTVALS